MGEEADFLKFLTACGGEGRTREGNFVLGQTQTVKGGWPRSPVYKLGRRVTGRKVQQQYLREANSRLGTGDDNESPGYSSSDRALVL
jgi:hypothetical protein